MIEVFSQESAHHLGVPFRYDLFRGLVYDSLEVILRSGLRYLRFEGVCSEIHFHAWVPCVQ